MAGTGELPEHCPSVGNAAQPLLPAPLQSDAEPPTQLHIHWGGMAGLQPLHHPQVHPAQGLLHRFKEPGQEEPPASHSHSFFFLVELALCWTKGCKGSKKEDYVAAKRRIRKVG